MTKEELTRLKAKVVAAVAAAIRTDRGWDTSPLTLAETGALLDALDEAGRRQEVTG